MKHGSALHDIHIRAAIRADVAEISRLLRSLSHTYSVSPDDPGAVAFLASLGEESVANFIARRNVRYLVAVTAAQELAGAAAISGNRRIEHLFVAPAHQGKGLSRRLWEQLRDLALGCGNPGVFEVNSSLNAVPVYERFGFVIAAPRVARHGGVYVPMILDLQSD